MSACESSAADDRLCRVMRDRRAPDVSMLSLQHHLSTGLRFTEACAAGERQWGAPGVPCCTIHHART